MFFKQIVKFEILNKEADADSKDYDVSSFENTKSKKAVLINFERVLNNVS